MDRANCRLHWKLDKNLDLYRCRLHGDSPFAVDFGCPRMDPYSPPPESPPPIPEPIPISASLPLDLVDAIEEESRVRDTSPDVVLSHAIAFYLDKNGPNTWAGGKAAQL